jgi:5'-methylthioadenosine phosphorylase
MRPANIAIVGGTGFEALPPEIFAEPIEVVTEHGPVALLSVSDNYTEPHHLYFLSRHSADHSLAPHQIDYRANTLALKQLDVGYIFATNAVGSLRADWPAGSFVVLSDFIDFTKHRSPTLFAGSGWRHVDFTEPYSPVLRRMLLAAATECGISAIPSATYVCCDGPRFETPAEIRLFRAWGGDVVGMTGLPEAIYAREAGIEYAAVAVVTNLGAGLSPEPVSHVEVVRAMSGSLQNLRDIAMGAARKLAESWVD